MTNLEYLEKVKEMDKERFSSEGRMLDKCLESIEFRKIKALEIIAEGLIKHNEYERIKFDYLKLKGIKVNT